MANYQISKLWLSWFLEQVLDITFVNIWHEVSDIKKQMITTILVAYK